MIVDARELLEMLQEFKKKYKLKNEDPIQLLEKKIMNNSTYYNFEINEIDVMEASLKSSFFIKSCQVIIDPKCGLRNYKLNTDLIIRVKKIKGNKIRLEDLDHNVLEIEQKYVKVASVPLEIGLFMDIMQ